jgi:hypothetical protein
LPTTPSLKSKSKIALTQPNDRVSTKNLIFPWKTQRRLWHKKISNVKSPRSPQPRSLLPRNKSNKSFNYWRMLSAYQSSNLALLHLSQLIQRRPLRSNPVHSIFRIHSSQTALWANFQPFLWQVGRLSRSTDHRDWPTMRRSKSGITKKSTSSGSLLLK